MNNSIIEQIDAILPQAQCKKCGYNGCKPYAIALSDNKADINQCPPGGSKGIKALSELLGIPVKPLNENFGKEKPRHIAVIIEKDCIGCTKCLPPCPVDAIIGASKQMHTVIINECTGCELCVKPCPVECIIMEPIKTDNELSAWTKSKADAARKRYLQKMEREEQIKADKIERLKKQKMALEKLKSAKH